MLRVVTCFRTLRVPTLLLYFWLGIVSVENKDAERPEKCFHVEHGNEEGNTTVSAVCFPGFSIHEHKLIRVI